TAALLAQRRAILAAIDVLHPKFCHQLLEGERLLNTGEVTDDGADAFGCCRFELLAYPLKGLSPGGGSELAEFTDVRPIKPLSLEAIPDETGLVGNPFLVHV